MIDERPERVIPLYEERLHVAKTAAVTDRLRVTTIAEERAVLVEDTVERANLDVERVAVDRAVDGAPEPRWEGDTLIVSLVEERPVVEKRLFVVEELRITRTSTAERVAIPETVRIMRATIERVDPATPGPATSSGSENNG